MTRPPWALAALAALGLARLLPPDGAGLYLRLAFATLVLLGPGALVARALRQSGPAATLAWSLGALVVALGFVFVVHTALWPALVVLAAIAFAVLAPALRRLPALPPPATVPVMLLGAVFGLLLWHVAGSLQGDALFHLARARKLDAFGDLHLRSVDEFRDGGLHPGYAFPLWHGFLALVAKLAGVDAAKVVLHEPTVLAPLAFGVVYEAGFRVFASAAAGFAVLAAQVALIALAPGHGGAYVFLSLPPTAARQLLVPAVIALFFAARPADLAAVAAAGLALAFVHVTYSVFVGIVLTGYIVARVLLAREVRGLPRLAAVAGPTLAVALWVHSLARTSASLTPDDVERRRALKHYASELDVFSLHRYRLAPEGLSRSGAVAVAALVVVPFAFAASRRRWAAFVLGGAVPVLALTLASFLFPHFADLVSLSQARRAAGFVPFAFALAGGIAVIAGYARWLVLPLALGAGIALQLTWPGDFGYGLREGGPGVAAWIALWGGLAASLVAAVWRGRELRGRGLVPLAALLFVAPVAVHGFSHWSARSRASPDELTAGLVRALDRLHGDVVFADLQTSYRISAAAPVYVAASLPYHVADTKANRRYARVRDVRRFFSSGDLSIPRRYGARWIVVHRPERIRGHSLRVVFADRRYALYALR